MLVFVPMHSLGSYKYMEDWGVACQQNHQDPKSPPGANDRKKAVYGAQNSVKPHMDHVWDCSSDQSQGFHFRAIQHLTHQPASCKRGIKAPLLRIRQATCWILLYSLLGFQKKGSQSRFFLERHSFTGQVLPFGGGILLIVKMAIIG